MGERPGESLGQQRGRLSVVLENAPVVLYGLDLGGRFTFSEGNGLAAVGLREGHVVGTLASELYSDTPAALEAIKGALGGKQTIFRAHFSEADFISRLTPIYDQDGALEEVVGVSLDIGGQVRAEHELDERDEQLRQSQKMEAVGLLAGGIAHDFNNLLTAIIGYSDLILTSEECPLSSVLGDVEEIKLAAERAASLTRQILTFSRRQALQPKVISLNDLIEETEPLLHRTLGERVQLDFVLEPQLGLVEVDAHQLVHVLLNLAINARDAMKGGGRIILETANIELDEEFCQTYAGATPGPHIMLTVTDFGVGMDEVTKSRAFEPFFTTKGPGEGTGLGLSTAYGIVRQSGGIMLVESELGKGATFRVYLPHADDPAIDQHTLAVPPLESIVQEAVILVVEDEAAVLGVVTRSLTAEGYLVLAASSAAQAMMLLEDNDRSIDLLLTDVRLSKGMQGDVLAQRAMALRAGLPVLLMSGYHQGALTSERGLGSGIALLQKPFTPDGLVARIREVLGSVT